MPILLMENVSQVHSSKNINDWRDWICKLETLGYTNFVEDINSKNYGIPQNRLRTFALSIPYECTYRFLPKEELKLKLKDILETNVDEKYFLSNKQMVLDTKNKALIETAKKLEDISEPQMLDCYNKKVSKEISNTITTGVDFRNKLFISIKNNDNNLCIRKLTPRECWRLMGVKDEDYDKVSINQSNASLYHLAGDSIVVQSLIAVLKNLF